MPWFDMWNLNSHTRKPLKDIKSATLEYFLSKKQHKSTQNWLGDTCGVPLTETKQTITYLPVKPIGSSHKVTKM